MTLSARTATLESLTEVELLQRMFSHEEAAWREFCRRYDRLIWRCITKVTTRFGNVLSPEDVREVYANFLVALMANDMHKLRTFQPEKGNKLGTWIGLLAINSAWDYLRAVARQPPGDSLAAAEERPSATPDPFEHVAQREECSRVEKLLRTFSKRDRTFVTLYFVDGRTPEEVADQMGISVKTVYSKKHKIRSRLEKLLVDRGVSLAA
jgi:RNA polymerase sigma-70 factor (ECF subfamily)